MGPLSAFAMKILVTGFKSFLGATSNPSETLALQLSHQFAEVESLILPVEFGRSSEILLAELQSKAFNYLLMLGQAGGRKNVCFEKVGLYR